MNLPEWQPGPSEKGEIVQHEGMIYRINVKLKCGEIPPDVLSRTFPAPWATCLGAVAHVTVMQGSLLYVTAYGHHTLECAYIQRTRPGSSIDRFFDDSDCDCGYRGLVEQLRAALAPFEVT